MLCHTTEAASGARAGDSLAHSRARLKSRLNASGKCLTAVHVYRNKYLTYWQCNIFQFSCQNVKKKLQLLCLNGFQHRLFSQLLHYSLVPCVRCLALITLLILLSCCFSFICLLHHISALSLPSSSRQSEFFIKMYQLKKRS